MSEIRATVGELEKLGILLVQDGNHGAGRPLRHEIVEGGIPHIRAADLENTFVNFEGAQGLAESAYARIRKGRGRPRDVLLSHKGTVGKVARVPPAAPRFLCSPQTTFWRSLVPDTVDPEYLFCYLRSPVFQAMLRARQNESDMAAYVSLTSQRRLQLVFPTIQEQRSIASVICALDDKIELNRRIAANLWQVWELEGRAWYDSMSRGGTYEPLDEIASFLNGLALQKYPAEDDGGLPVIKIRELKSGVTESTGRASRGIESRFVVDAGDLLFSWSGSLELKVWTGERGALNQHLFKVSSERFSQWFVHLAVGLHLEEFRAIARDKATTMGHINRGHLSAAQVAVPSARQLEAVDARLQSLYDAALAREIENLSLAATRDALLPKLMSGELRVKDAEQRVEAVL